MATEAQIRSYILKIKTIARKLHAVNKELRGDLSEAQATAAEQAEGFEHEISELQSKIDALDDRNEVLSGQLAKCQNGPDRSSAAIASPNEWKTLARNRIKSGHMTEDEWGAVLESLLFQHDDLGGFNEAVEHGFRALYARSDARTWVDNIT